MEALTYRRYDNNKAKKCRQRTYIMISCRICGKNLDDENAFNHIAQHDKKGEIPHSER